MTHSSELTELVTIERETQTADGRGGYTSVWTAWAENILVKIEDQSGTEVERAQRLDATQKYKVTAWAHEVEGITTKDRVKWGGIYMQVRACPPAQRRLFRPLSCEAGVAQ